MPALVAGIHVSISVIKNLDDRDKPGPYFTRRRRALCRRVCADHVHASRRWLSHRPQARQAHPGRRVAAPQIIRRTAGTRKRRAAVPEKGPVMSKPNKTETAEIRFCLDCGHSGAGLYSHL